MANIAKFTIEGTASATGGYDATTGQVLDLALEGGASGSVQRWTVQVYDPNDPTSPFASAGAPLLTVVGATSGQKVDATTPGATVTITAPSGMNAWIVRSIVNGGLDAKGRANPDYVFERMVVVRDGSGRRKIVATEQTQYGPDGWAKAVNEHLAASPASVPNGTEVAHTLQWDGAAYIKKRGWIILDSDPTGTTAADAKLASAIASRNGACVELPEGITRITSPKSIGLHGVSIVGRSSHESILELDGAADQDWLVLTGGTFGNRIQDLHIRRKTMPSATPAGYAIKAVGTFGLRLYNVWLEQVENGMRVQNCTDTELASLKMRNIFGGAGLKIDGVGVNGNQTVIDMMQTDNGYAGGYPSMVNGIVNWTASAAVTAGMIVIVAGVLSWQVSTSGSLGTTNTSLLALPSTDPTLARSTAVTNGSAQLKFIGRADLDWIFWDSRGGDVKATRCALLNGGRGIRLEDTQTSNAPNIGKFTDIEIDHPLLQGVRFGAGSDVTLTRVDTGNCQTGTGISVETAFGRDWRIRDCNVLSNAQHGIAVVNSGWGSISGCQLGYNSQQTNNTYDGIVTGTVTELDIVNCRSGDIRNLGAANRQRYGVNVGAGSTQYTIQQVTARGNQTSGITHPAGAGANVGNNR